MAEQAAGSAALLAKAEKFGLPLNLYRLEFGTHWAGYCFS